MPKYELSTTAEVPTRDALKSYTGRSSTVSVSQGDDPGIFRHDESDLTSPDDGTDIIVDYQGRRWRRIGQGILNLKNYGAAGNGTTNDAAAFDRAVTAALAAGKSLYVPSGTYNIDTVKSFTYTGRLSIYGDGDATLVLGGASTVALSFSATSVLSTTLASNAAYGDRSISVTSATGVAVGQLLHLGTSTAVDTGFSYAKQAVVLVAGVSGTTVYLSEPLNFAFTTAETTLSFRAKASLVVDGVNIKQGTGVDRRFDLRYLQDSELSNLDVRAYDEFLGDVVLLGECHGTKGRNLGIYNGRYTINVNTGSRNSVFEDIYAQDCRHPIDANTWAFNTMTRRMRSVNTQLAIQCHPCFESHFEDCTDFSESSPGGGVALRCIGGSVKRCKVSNLNGTAIADSQSPNLLSAYQSIGQLYNRVYEDIESDTAILGGGDIGTLFIRRCKVANISVDGSGNRVGYVSIDTDTEITEDRMVLSRVQVLSPSQPVWVTPTSSFASVNTIKDITGITAANPPVVTAVAHGYSNGDQVRIDGVGGMTQVNETTFTAANVATDTFELLGIDGTSYTAYTSGGKATLGRMAQTIDPLRVPGLGWSPNFHAKAVIRRDASTLNPNTSVTIPVKIVNSYGISEDNLRHVMLTVRSVSSTDGYAVNRYQLFLFTSATSGSGISASATAVAVGINSPNLAVSNLRHHYSTQVTNEGGSASADPAIGEYYYSFDVVVTASATTDRVQYVEIEVEEIRVAAS